MPKLKSTKLIPQPARTRKAIAEPVREPSHAPPFEATEQSFKLGDPGAPPDELREELGESFVKTVTSGEQVVVGDNDREISGLKPD